MSLSRRGSGTGTIPVFGSMVQNGKFSAAIAALVNALNRVDLPTLGKPTIPQLKPMKLLTKCYLKIAADFTTKPSQSHEHAVRCWIFHTLAYNWC